MSEEWPTLIDAQERQDWAMETEREGMMQDEELDDLLRRTAYITNRTLAENGLDGKTDTELAQAICKENRKELYPEAIVYERGSLRLTFDSESRWDTVLVEKLAIDSVRLELLQPKMMYRKTIYIFGIPQFFSDYTVKMWLECHSMTVVSDFRKLLHKDAPFWNTGRSVVVEVSKKKDIPGFLPLESESRSARKIAIWYPGIGPWC